MSVWRRISPAHAPSSSALTSVCEPGARGSIVMVAAALSGRRSIATSGVRIDSPCTLLPLLEPIALLDKFALAESCSSVVKREAPAVLAHS